MVFFKITKRCIRCRKPERNDGTEENPKWVCDNPKCVRYVPPVEGVENAPSNKPLSD